MPAERAPMRKVREVLRLRHALGVSERQIAITTGVSRSTVGEYLRRAAVVGITWPVPEGLDDAALERRLFTPPTFDEKPARPLPDWSDVHKELKRRAVTLLLLWEEYRAEHVDGYGYSRFCDLYRDWCKTISATMRQTHGAAEKLFVDFAGDTVPVFDAALGVERRAHIFVAVLGASNYTYAQARWSEGLADWIGAHVNAFSEIGGVPKAVVCDNLKAGVTAACRYEPGSIAPTRSWPNTTTPRSSRRVRGDRATRPRSKWPCKSSSASCWPGCATAASSRSMSSMPRSARPSPIRSNASKRRVADYYRR
jgi:transposase